MTEASNTEFTTEELLSQASGNATAFILTTNVSEEDDTGRPGPCQRSAFGIAAFLALEGVAR